MKTFRLVGAVFVLIFTAVQLVAAPAPLVPREVLFGNPERFLPKLSPDGRRVAWMAFDKSNVMQVWVGTIGAKDEKVVTPEKKTVRSYRWAADDKTLLFLADSDGTGVLHVYGVDLASGIVRDYTPLAGVRGDLVAVAPDVPNEILVRMNARDRRQSDVYRVDLSTGALILDTQNPGDVAAWFPDSHLRILGALSATAGGTELRVRATPQAPWHTLIKAGAEDVMNLVGFSRDSRAAYIETSIGSDTVRLVEKDLSTGAEKVIANANDVDAGAVMINPKTQAIEAVSFESGRPAWRILDSSVKPDFDALAKIDPGFALVSDRDSADKTWLVTFRSDRHPVSYYAWDRATKKATFLFSVQPKLEGVELSQMKPVVITSRDGLPIHAYLTLPSGVAAKNLPLVVFPHEPWQRDYWGWMNIHQWLANRGYAVLSADYRGSSGYGRKFLHAGDRQWGAKMQDDLVDAVRWTVRQGYVDPKRVAMFGDSYGGYATLVGMTSTPETFACGVDVGGYPNLKTFLSSMPADMRGDYDARVANVNDPKDAELIRTASPLFKADRIRRPLLIAEEKDNPNKAESEQMLAAIEKNHGAATYLVYGGDSVLNRQNRLDFYARAETFLSQCLGGRAELMPKEGYPTATVDVKMIGGK